VGESTHMWGSVTWLIAFFVLVCIKWVMMCLWLIILLAVKLTQLSTFFMLKHYCCGHLWWIMRDLWPKCNEWRNCETMV
jgi:hypothetical protein